MKCNKWSPKDREEMPPKNGLPLDWFECIAACKLLSEYSGTGYSVTFDLRGGHTESKHCHIKICNHESH